MKKKGIAALLAAAMIASSISVPTFARYDVENSQYVFHDTTNLEAVIDPATEQIVLTWPAVNKEGQLLNQNPLRAEGQTQSNGNPTRGWTNPTNGMIIEYDGWLPDGTHNKVSNDNKPDHNVLMGVVDYETEYPIFIKDPKRSDVVTSADAVKAAYIDTTVVSTSLATAYQVQYSEDGINWTEDHITSTFNHGKKLTREKAVVTESGTTENKLVDDNKNTFFLESQITEPMTAAGLKPDTKYYIKVNAFDGSNPASKATPYKTFETEITTPAAKVLTPAFPTVEGGGTYSQGGRGGDVYVVTNLTDSVSNPQPGSLRYGLERMDTGNKTAPRTIVFAVGGTIHIDETAPKASRRMNVNSNTTILGQTAPGEGITVAGSSMKFDGENIIVRYMRFRLGGGYDLDAATATGKYIVIDHCSFGWGVDEVFSAKEILNSSIQYNIISSGLGMPNKNGALNNDAEINSGESEAKHGMGSILNGYETSYTHNLWAHNGTRNPRFEGGFSYGGIRYENKIDYANNVVYNWGHNASYGGERGKGQMNFVGNYYKPGPETLEKVKYLMDCDADGDNKGSYYVSGNTLTTSDEITSDNVKGFNEVANATILTEPVKFTVPYEATSAYDAYSKVLYSAGASHQRDAQDNRLMQEVTLGKGSFINDPSEAGGWNDEVFTSSLTDSDNDGMPDDYETKVGLNPQDASDAAAIIEDESSFYKGYSNIEVYAGYLVKECHPIQPETIEREKSVPHGQVEKILDENGNDVMKENGSTTLVAGKTYTVYGTEITSSDSDIIYLNDKVASGSGLTFTPDTVGMYNLSCLMKSPENNAFTIAVPVTVVKGENNIDGFTSTDIGAVGAAGTDNYDPESNTLVSQGAGRIGITNTSSSNKPDIFHYNYRMVTGDFSFTAKLDNLAKIDYRQKSGLMVRESLEPDTKFYMAALTYLKGEDLQKNGKTDVTGQINAKNIMAFARNSAGRPVSEGKFLGVPAVREGETPINGYARIERTGNIITLSASKDKENWYEIGKYTTTLPETCYVGFATSAAQDTSAKIRYNATAFSEIELNANSSEVLLGDVNCDGIITAADSALLLQYVLDSQTPITPQGHINAKVEASDIYTANAAACILQKALNTAYKFPVEQ